MIDSGPADVGSGSEDDRTRSGPRDRVRTPRELAAILNPGVDLRLPSPDPETPAVLPAPAPVRPPFRDRVRRRMDGVELLLFRVGAELFATDLAAVEEAVELPEVRALPEMADAMLGIFDLRGRMTPIYTPERALGVARSVPGGVALLMRAGERRVALAVDDVDDVLRPDLALLRDPPTLGAVGETILGVLRQGSQLIAIVDADALVAACVIDSVLETA
ncbi:MAG: hypothetical protein NVS9B3_01180 [Gemmatimonadaceae bacterium]